MTPIIGCSPRQANRVLQRLRGRKIVRVLRRLGIVYTHESLTKIATFRHALPIPFYPATWITKLYPKWFFANQNL